LWHWLFGPGSPGKSLREQEKGDGKEDKKGVAGVEGSKKRANFLSFNIAFHFLNARKTDSISKIF
jgi:hypothetical protein